MSEVLARSNQLRENMTLQNLFSILCADGDKVAARYLDGDEEKAITYGEYKERTFACAAMLRAAIGENRQGSFVGIQADTCPEWFYLFWGVMAAGYNAVLMDFTLNDDMTAYIAMISIDDFMGVELRTAQVAACERVPRAKKLLKLTLDLGYEQRTVVSGIAKFYEPEALVGKKIVIVANLKPAVLCGIESNGMILASGEEVVRVVFLDPETPLGERVR